MAINLNKGGQKKSFNLSKGPSASEVDTVSKTEERSKKSTSWVYIILALVILGGGIWYFTRSKSEPLVEGVQSNTDSSNTKASISGQKNNVGDSSLNVGATQQTGNVTTKGTVDSLGDRAQNDKTGTSANSNSIAGELDKKVTADFGPGSASIKTLHSEILKKLTEYLKGNPNSKVTLTGYASSEGDPTVNQSLSEKRAESFKNLLIKNGIDGDRILTKGEGENNPIASNETQEGRRKNRRVEISM